MSLPALIAKKCDSTQIFSEQISQISCLTVLFVRTAHPNRLP